MIRFKEFVRVSSVAECTKVGISPFVGTRPATLGANNAEIFSKFKLNDVAEQFHDVTLNLYTLRDCYMLIKPDYDGLVFNEEGQIIQETAIFSSIPYLDAAKLAGLEIDTSNCLYLKGNNAFTFDTFAKNYYHWTNFALGKSYIMSGIQDNYTSFIFPDFDDAFPYRNTYFRLLASVGLNPKINFLSPGLFKIESLQFIWTDLLKPTHIMDFPKMFTGLRDIAKRQWPINRLKASAHRRLYFGRREKFQARMSIEFAAKLEAILNKHHFEKLYLEEHDISTQAEIISQADVIIAPHGSALTNIMFAPEETLIIELNREIQGELRPWFYQMSGGLNQKYICFDIETPGAAEELDKFLGQL
jgi:hypothetical protein